MLKVPSYRQRPGYCGPASLKMIFAYYGVHLSEKSIAKKARTTKKWGTSGKQMVLAAKKYGYDSRLKDNSSLKDLKRYLKKGAPPIVNWFSKDDGHYSVVIGLDRKKIYLRDPEKKGLTALDLEMFERCWFDFLANKKQGPKSLIMRRMIVIERKQKRN